MQSLIGFDPTSLIVAYGYPVITLIVALESMGIPLPGETALLAAAVYAGATHQLSIVFIVLAATAGAVLGDNAGFWIGRRLGFPLLRQYGRFVRLDEGRLNWADTCSRDMVERSSSLAASPRYCAPWPRLLLARTIWVGVASFCSTLQVGRCGRRCTAAGVICSDRPSIGLPALSLSDSP